MPDEILQTFLRVLRKLAHLRVVWKWEGEKPRNVPPNVLMDSWLPQQDLLGIIK